MNCPNCQHVNDGGNFCEQCGTKLAAEYTPPPPQPEVQPVQGGAVQYAQTTQTVPPPQPNAHLENAKQASKMYFSYFMTVLKKPVAATQHTNRDQLTNGLISIGLFALIIPLILYFSIDPSGEGAFIEYVIKPTVSYGILILLIATYTFVSIKLGKVSAGYADVIARFGSMLIPFLGLFFVALIMSLLDMYLFPVLLGIGFFGSVFILPPLVISSFKKDTSSGLDVLYGTLLTYLAIFITFIVMAAFIIATLFEQLGSLIPF
ncbi:zinc ribbon domain-containing protein [Bacillus salacetis]|uniref:zinc ribbon domain-containing protein n=1 Tax=Bacillus salacetis TaxID=2315464 RepID=UPI003BA2A470